MHQADLLTVALIGVLLLAGCNALDGRATDGSTVTPAPVPTDLPTTSPFLAPTDGYMFIENNRSEPYTVTLTMIHQPVTTIKIRYKNGTVARHRLSPRNPADLFFVYYSETVIDVIPVNTTSSTTRHVIAPDSAMVVPLPKRSGNLTVLYEVKQKGAIILDAAEIVSCDRNQSEIIAQISLRLQLPNGVMSGHTCSNPTNTTLTTAETVSRIPSG